MFFDRFVISLVNFVSKRKEKQIFTYSNDGVVGVNQMFSKCD